jgi:hypothetical protein
VLVKSKNQTVVVEPEKKDNGKYRPKLEIDTNLGSPKLNKYV